MTLSRRPDLTLFTGETLCLLITYSELLECPHVHRNYFLRLDIFAQYPDGKLLRYVQDLIASVLCPNVKTNGHIPDT